jgi:hypothetical protein
MLTSASYTVGAAEGQGWLNYTCQSTPDRQVMPRSLHSTATTFDPYSSVHYLYIITH